MHCIGLLTLLPVVLTQSIPVDVIADPSCDDTSEVCGADLAGVSLLQHRASIVEKASNTVVAKGTQGQETVKHTRKSRRAQKSSSKGAPWFFNVDTMDCYQLILCTLFYGYVLYVGSNMLGDGSEQLGFFSSVRGIVGSIIVPILGAVPDSMMVLFSGLGPDAQTQVTTGVGALAGSTVMLLTFPWFVVNMAGSVPVGEDGKADYKSDKKAGMFNSAVTYGPSVGTNAKIMVLTSLSFLIIQIPAWFWDHNGISLDEQIKQESIYAGIGLVVACLFFIGYITYCFFSDDGSDVQLKIIKNGISNGDCTLAGALFANQEHKEELISKIVPLFFSKYDDDGNKTLDQFEFGHVLHDLGESAGWNAQKTLEEFDKANTSKGDDLNLSEFTEWLKKYMSDPARMDALSKKDPVTPKTAAKYALAQEDDDDDVEVPEDLADLSPEEQARGMLMKALFNLIVGTILVLFFADPAVDVFDEWGVKLGISSFYVSFLLAPFASNASELLVAYGMALKKTGSSITMSFESLIGAACMNNTMCLGVFFALIYFEGLAWKFKAETLGIMVIQWLMAIIVCVSDTQRKAFGFVILMLYPLCLLIVWFCENELGWD